MIFLGGDKHGLKTIDFVINYLEAKKINFQNLGLTQQNPTTSLEIFLPEVASQVLKSVENMGIVSCGTGIGVEVGINKFSGIRACLVVEPKFANWARVYDKCNVLCLPGWEISQTQINSILDAWFSGEYDGSQSRLKMFETFDSWK